MAVLPIHFNLSDIEEILALRGNEASYENIRYWCLKFGNRYTKKIRSRTVRNGDTWYLDEVFISIRDERIIYGEQ